MTTVQLRLSDLVLDRELNPAGDADIGGATPDRIIEACGIIPDFFAEACLPEGPRTLQQVADDMEAGYGFGGFCYPLGGAVSPQGVYSYPEDPDLYPLVRYRFGAFECYVYPYAITAIRDVRTGECKVGRFD